MPSVYREILWIGLSTSDFVMLSLATALLDIEPWLRKVKGYRHLLKLREAS